MKYYMTKENRAYEIIFNGNSIESVKEINPIEKLGDLKYYNEWTLEKMNKVKMFFEYFG